MVKYVLFDLDGTLLPMDQDVLDAIGAKPEECVMVGNDVQDDMITATLGIQTFLLTDCIMNKNGADISGYRQGSFDALAAFIAQL